MWQHLITHDEVRLAGLGARDMLRMEAGLCLYGQELSETITPPEAGLSWTIGMSRRTELSKPFLGSEFILAQLNERCYSTITPMPHSHTHTHALDHTCTSSLLCAAPAALQGARPW